MSLDRKVQRDMWEKFKNAKPLTKALVISIALVLLFLSRNIPNINTNINKTTIDNKDSPCSINGVSGGENTTCPTTVVQGDKFPEPKFVLMKSPENRIPFTIGSDTTDVYYVLIKVSVYAASIRDKNGFVPKNGLGCRRGETGGTLMLNDGNWREFILECISDEPIINSDGTLDSKNLFTEVDDITKFDLAIPYKYPQN